MGGGGGGELTNAGCVTELSGSEIAEEMEENGKERFNTKLGELVSALLWLFIH